MQVKYDAQTTKRALMHFADNIGPDQHEHLYSLILTFSVCQHILQQPLILSVDKEGPGKPAHMHRLIRACTVHKLHMGPFHVLNIIYYKTSLWEIRRVGVMGR